MESLDARLKSFAKSKRVKSSTTGKLVTLKWSHPASFSANPSTLAEAGFYFNPSPDHRDSVTCFMCAKELSDWERDDDPFAIHLEKARGTCAWALVRCYLGEDGDDSPDSSMLPSSKTMEKARLETFRTGWPHDTTRGHGANSKKMAKAGFAYTPQSPADDTASCFYCGVALSGWDADDDPLEEHRKREAKASSHCRFLSSLTNGALAASTSSQAKPKRMSTRPPSRTHSRKKVEPIDEDDSVQEFDPDEDEQESEDEIHRDRAARASRSMKSMGRKASTVPAKTPASSSQKAGRSNRSKRTTTAASHADLESDVAEVNGDESEQEAGKKVSRSKSKRTLAKSKSKGHIDIIEEEEEGLASAPTANAEIVEPVEEKPKRRGRPPGSGKRQKEKAAAERAAAVAAASKMDERKVTSPAIEASESADDSDIEEIPPAKLKSKHTRTRSKMNLQAGSDADSPVSVPSTSKSHSQAKPSANRKKPHSAMEVEVVVPPPSSSHSHSVKGKGKQLSQEGETSVYEAEAKPKDRASRSKPKPSGDDSMSENEIEMATNGATSKVELKTGDRAAHTQRVIGPPRSADEHSSNLKRKSSVTSDDAGYATAATDHRMDVDVGDVDAYKLGQSLPSEPPNKKLAVGPQSKTKSNGHVHRAPLGAETITVRDLSRATSSSTPPPQPHVQKLAQAPAQPSQKKQQGPRSTRPESSKPAVRVSSRPLTRAPSRTGYVNENEIVDVSSDEEPEFTTPPPHQKTERKSSEGEFRSRILWMMLTGEQRRGKLRKASSSSSQVPAHRADTIAVQEEQIASVPQVDSDVEMTDAHEDDQPPRTSQKLVETTAGPPDEAVEDEHTELSHATPPPHTPTASPRDTTSPRVQTAPLPSFDEDIASESHSESFTPFLSLVPVQMLSSLSEEECNMTIEEFIRREIELQYQQFKEDGERKIALFKEQAAETRRTIETA
ncbi:hypothetical protein NM688_g1031 [Phlebia brevispora]|uniref:Uncharacterized protein n=1 Tax=Phlebia brevispora TaxID=194682 RepID=A0ACC1TCB5_9APHY|nr:hypothetical protein NM688_g1031 [Phlebia brevispora]